MPVPDSNALPPSSGATVFPSTHWSVVLSAGNEASLTTDLARERLCRAYWYPLYAYVRRVGRSPEDAEDLVQGFFAYLLEKNSFGRAHKEIGRFRTFLLSALKNYLHNEHDKVTAKKRGGGQPMISL